jgi:carboxylate-amine ligase
VWEENRFVAARDGIDARLIVATEGVRVPVADRMDELLPRLRPHAQDLGCADELEGVLDLVRENGAKRQLAIARGEDRLPGLVQALSDAY